MVLLQTLLRHGANRDLRDEDGKTPLDKARERGDDGHREVINILQSPGKAGSVNCSKIHLSFGHTHSDWQNIMFISMLLIGLIVVTFNMKYYCK